MSHKTLVALSLSTVFAAAGHARAQTVGGTSCEGGAYRSAAGEIVALTAPPANAPPGARYVFIDGRRGYTSDADAPLSCEAGVLRGRGPGGGEAWTPIHMRATTTTFMSHGARLFGLLLEPESAGKPPLVILSHGSENTSSIRLYAQYLLTAQGVSTFFYDKRGVGGSGGTYTQDFRLLAEDGANAAREARRLAAGRFGRLGFYGGSQGGWVAPLAAVESKADFVEVGFGVVGNPLEQDEWQVDYQLKQQGFGADITPQVHEVTDATAKVAESDFSAHFDGLARMREKYGKAPWFSKIDGQYSGELLRGEIARAKSESPQVPWDYPAESVLKQLRIPQIWVFARDDSTAPSAHSIARLQALRKAGQDIRIVVFPDTDHGIQNFTTDASGKRTNVRVADGYIRLLADWARGVDAPPYGASYSGDTAGR